MATATWPLAAAKLGVTEGGYWDDPVGGPTNRGITLNTLRSNRKVLGLSAADAVTLATLKALTEDDARKIWKAGYWDRACCDRLPVGLDYAVFDVAINSGPAKAIELLQAAQGLHADGIFGPLTESSMKRANIPLTIARLGALRLQFMTKLKNWKPNSAGWAVRVATVTADAIALA
ncbi:glycosyl hydrolase 108 family protein [Mesorhizobium sp. B2-3-10]|uniref:glycoside hydrolase family 108 protein n=1 Tax=Mesorhizobium sp. B2-3-10 TaxID=2589954 RepID=UPI0015E2AFFC|nr:glycosyl hydrolase 108 family protein [Mesorhizobium sp. B2-3-10]